MPLLNKKFPKRKIFLSLVLGLFLIFLIFFAPARNVIVRFFVAVSRPLLNLNKKDDEISVLKNRVAELESKILSYPSQSLPSVKENYILGGIISRPPQSPYDIFVIDAGSDNGVKQGMTATAFSNILLGYMTDVFPKTSKIKLISFPGEETNALIESVSTGVKISATATGRGGGEMEIKLPSSLEIHSGDRITTPGIHPLILGVVERAEINLSDPFQKIFFRLPVNFQELNYIMIEK